jgi:hypothetical protein
VIQIRLAKPRDWPMIQMFHRDQNEAQGTSYELPQLFDKCEHFAPNIAAAFIVERDGNPVQAFYFELIPEVCFAGCDPQATAYARREIDRIAFCLRSMGYSGINCKVPKQVEKSISAPLKRAGFTSDEGLAHFFKDLRLPVEVEEEQENG